MLHNMMSYSYRINLYNIMHYEYFVYHNEYECRACLLIWQSKKLMKMIRNTLEQQQQTQL